jgi:hypothetical protein
MSQSCYLTAIFAPQEALKRPMKQKRKLRIFISNTFYPAKEPSEGEEGSVASWELRVEGRLLEDNKNDPNKVCIILFICEHSVIVFQWLY